LNFTKKLADTEAITSQTAVLECAVSKDGPPLVWKKNGQEIKPDGKKFEIIKDGTNYKLLIKELTLEDDGEYSCYYGEDETTCRLHIEGTPFVLIVRIRLSLVTQRKLQKYKKQRHYFAK
jgi:hypothetical protein